MKKYPNSEEEDRAVNKLSDIDLTGFYSYANYMRWDIEERLEIIKGQIYLMSAPFRKHQEVSGVMFAELFFYLKGKPCKVYSAPFDVRLTHQSKEDKDVTTVVQPDLCVVCDPEKLDERGCIGAPDIVVEVLSPSNNKKELNIKYHLYEEFGVKEYWVVHPKKKSVMKYVLDDEGKYDTEGPFTDSHQFTSKILPGFVLNLEEVFA